MPADQMTRTKVADRRAAVLRAMAAGFTPDQIAQTVDGVRTAKQAADDARRGLADAVVLRKLAAGDRERLLELELLSLGTAQRAVEGVLRRQSARGGEGNSDRTVLAAADMLVRIAERRHALEGLGMGQPMTGQPEDELSRRRRQVGARRRMA